MNTTIQLYNDIETKVTVLYKQLKLSKHEQHIGRPRSLSIIQSIALALFKHTNGIPTKKAIWKIFALLCSYKTLVVSMNRWLLFALKMLVLLTRMNRRTAHPVKHTDSTAIPVCLPKNADGHRTMRGLARWGYGDKRLYYGLKLHITTDMKQNLLSFTITPANRDDRKEFMNLNGDMDGIFVADAGYVSQKLADAFNTDTRVLLARPYKRMKKLMSELEALLYRTRVRIEVNFRNLKQFHGLVTSLPRSIDGYL